ncbi:FAS1 domain-containing protein [Desarmillaria tabescens]|uniref:FAS1 domain-containing protein n=1 Tax=Armillaria tabescens TaxID=1929756 RepID=A0AA39NMQ8_ARMTA|nr:FAS1 domain-containing protein [Desarmillaria tabescens]KAK0468496.1 FAS1 domain-containing protein [Desarmillaria tabescens]
MSWLYLLSITFSMMFSLCQGQTQSLLGYLKNRSDTSKLVEWIETPPGSFTFFAPNNDAIESLNERYRDWLVSPLGRDTIGNLLIHHYVPNTKFMTSSFNETYGRFQTGSYLLVGAQAIDNTVVLNRVAHIVEGDINVDSGIVHIIDRVLSHRIRNGNQRMRGSSHRHSFLDRVLILLCLTAKPDTHQKKKNPYIGIPLHPALGRERAHTYIWYPHQFLI